MPKKKFNLIQSHERIPYCEIFRAGDGVHKSWLKQRSRILPRYKYLLQLHSQYHKYILKSEETTLHSPKLKYIICNSQMVKKEIMHYYNILENKIILIYNSVDLKKFFPANNEEYHKAKKSLCIPLKSHTLVYIGSGFERKGLQQAIRAFAPTNYYLIIIGHDHHAKLYKSLAKELGCFSRTRFIGRSNHILPYYHAADALILPTLYDPFPNVILEAMACELPIITTWQCGASDLIESGKEGFICDALDIKKLQQFIREIPLKNNNPHMGIMAKNKIIKLTKNYLAKELNKIYKKILFNTY